MVLCSCGGIRRMGVEYTNRLYYVVYECVCVCEKNEYAGSYMFYGCWVLRVDEKRPSYKHNKIALGSGDYLIFDKWFFFFFASVWEFLCEQ